MKPGDLMCIRDDKTRNFRGLCGEKPVILWEPAHWRKSNCDQCRALAGVASIAQAGIEPMDAAEQISILGDEGRRHLLVEIALIVGKAGTQPDGSLGEYGDWSDALEAIGRRFKAAGVEP